MIGKTNMYQLFYNKNEIGVQSNVSVEFDESIFTVATTVSELYSG